MCSECNGVGYKTITRESDVVIEQCKVCQMKVIICGKGHVNILFAGRSELDCPLCAVKRVLHASNLDVKRLENKIRELYTGTSKM